MGQDLIEVTVKGDLAELKQLLDDPESSFRVDPGNAINKRNREGKSALDMAAMLGRKEVVRELTERGADVNSKTIKGYTALHRAASWGHVDCLKVLVAQGCDLQIRNSHGERAREAAARYGQESCVNCLDKAEAVIGLREFIATTKDIISDPDKHLGRITKDDRVSGNKFCDEKSDWLEAHKESSTMQDVHKQRQDLKESLKPILCKLEENGNTNLKDGKK